MSTCCHSYKHPIHCHCGEHTSCSCNPCCYPPDPEPDPIEDITCETYMECTDNELIKIAASSATELPHFCEAVTRCVGSSLGDYAIGAQPFLNTLPGALVAALKSLPGYSATGTKVLKSVDGVISWENP